MFAGLLSLLFYRPLIDLVAYAAKSSMYSHTLLIPLISVYLARQKWRSLEVTGGANAEAGVSEFRGFGQQGAGDGGKGAGDRGKGTGDGGQGKGDRRQGAGDGRRALCESAEQAIAVSVVEDCGEEDVGGQRSAKPVATGRRGGLLGAGLLTLIAIVVLGFYFASRRQGHVLARDDYLFLTVLPYVCLLAAGGFMFLGAQVMRVLAFPWIFLVFMVPFPVAVIDWIETFLQYASAEASHLLFAIGGTPYLRDGLRFDLPGISIEVARECSGIRSSLVLFITSLLAGHMFLRSGWKRAALALAVVPLGILRNGFRVFTIGMLSANVDIGIIDSALHRRGGPIFFVLSLIPFLGLLWWLRWLERPGRNRSDNA